MPELILRHRGQERNIELPREILDALWERKTNLVLACIGWDPENGILSTATSPNVVTRGTTVGAGDAGRLSVRLTNDVWANEETLETKFLPHGTRTR